MVIIIILGLIYDDDENNDDYNIYDKIINVIRYAYNLT